MSPWEDDSAQFPRLLDEINAVGLEAYQLHDICSSMDLLPEQVRELFDRAGAAWERAKEQARGPQETKVQFLAALEDRTWTTVVLRVPVPPDVERIVSWAEANLLGTDAVPAGTIALAVYSIIQEEADE